MLQTLMRRESLGEAQSYELFHAMLSGHLEDPLIGAFLALLASKGPSVDELTGAARVMREHVTGVPFQPSADERLIDTCGTGGAPKAFNISTAAAIVAASARGRQRVVVAKHGNRSRTGRGSAEVLAGLGVGVDASPTVQAACLREAGVCFCFAIHHHPAMRYASAARKALGLPTIFNVLGPLTNPAGARRQLIGVYDASFVPLLIQTLVRIGAERAMVVHGEDGLDELTTTGHTRASILQDGRVIDTTIHAAALGIARTTLATLSVDTVEEAVEAVRSVLAGEPGPKRDITLLNAAAALVVGEAADSMEEGLALAREAIDSGRAVQTLQTLERVSRSAPA